MGSVKIYRQKQKPKKIKKSAFDEFFEEKHRERFYLYWAWAEQLRIVSHLERKRTYARLAVFKMRGNLLKIEQIFSSKWRNERVRKTPLLQK